MENIQIYNLQAPVLLVMDKLKSMGVVQADDEKVPDYVLTIIKAILYDELGSVIRPVHMDDVDSKVLGKLDEEMVDEILTFVRHVVSCVAACMLSAPFHTAFSIYDLEIKENRLVVKNYGDYRIYYYEKHSKGISEDLLMEIFLNADG